jgi:hypothetical protein
VSPPAGTALHTQFSLLAAGWVDQPEDLPLLYSFARRRPLAGDPAVSLSRPAAAAGLSTQLPPGFGRNGSLLLSVRVEDALGAAASCGWGQAGGPVQVGVRPLAADASPVEQAAATANRTAAVLQQLAAGTSSGGQAVLQVLYLPF